MAKKKAAKKVTKKVTKKAVKKATKKVAKKTAKKKVIKKSAPKKLKKDLGAAPENKVIGILVPDEVYEPDQESADDLERLYDEECADCNDDSCDLN
jgi:hypothetical protein